MKSFSYPSCFPEVCIYCKHMFAYVCMYVSICVCKYICMYIWIVYWNDVILKCCQNVFKTIYIKYRISKFIVNIIDIFLFKIPFPFRIDSFLLGRMKEGIPNLTKFSDFLLHLL